MSFKKKAILGFLLILFLTTFIWHPVLRQALIAEGPTYFSEPYVSMVEGSFSELIRRHDVQALIFFYLVGPWFRDQMVYYMSFLLFGVYLVNVSLFFLVYKATKSFWAGLITCLLFVANFIGSFEMLGYGYYQWFIQRVPNFSLVLISLLILIHALGTGKDKKIKYLIISSFLYVVALILAHYSLLGSFLLISYPILQVIFSKKKSFRYEIIYVGVIILSSYLVIRYQNSLASNGSIIEMFKTINVGWAILREITLLTIPLDVIRFLMNSLNKLEQTQVFSFSINDIISILAIPITIFYLVAIYLTIKIGRTSKSFVLSVVLSLVPVLIFSIYLKPTFILDFDSSRYLYFPSLLISTILGMFFYSISKTKVVKILVTIVIFLWFSYNRSLINQNFVNWQDRHDVVLKTIDYIHSHIFPANSLVILPQYNGNYGSTMIEKFNGSSNIKYLPFSEDLSTQVKKLHLNPSKLIILDYRNGEIKEGIN